MKLFKLDAGSTSSSSGLDIGPTRQTGALQAGNVGPTFFEKEMWTSE